MPAAGSTRLTGEDVVSCAVELLESEGFAAMSVRRLGERLGVSRQIVYTHFGGMDGLWDALHRRAYDGLRDELVAVGPPTGEVAHVLAVGRAYLESARRRPRLFELAFARPVPGYVPTAETIAASRRSFVPVVEAVAAWLGTGVGVEDDDAVELAQVLWSTTHGHVTLELAGFVAPDRTDRLVERAGRAVLAGWR